MKEAIAIIYRLVHEMQLERGLASCYLADGSMQIAERLEQQFNIVDGLHKKLDALGLKQRNHFEPFQNALNYLPSKRKHIISRSLSAGDAILFYSRDIISQAMEVIQELAVLDKNNVPSRTTSLMNFLQWKERVGLERAIGAQIVSRGDNEAPELNSRINYLIEEQHAYERVFLALTDDYCRLAIENLENNNEVFQKIELINNSLAVGKKSEFLIGMSANDWFALFSAKMDLLHEIGKTLVSHLGKDTNQANKKPIDAPKGSIAANSIILERLVNAQFTFISQLPLFSGMAENDLKNLLRHARITNFSKGNIIFMQGEHATRFYIVLDGWVKLFKGDLEGHESILKIVNRGESLMESVLLRDCVFPVSAQAVENATLLSIPSSIIRDEMQKNQFLAINMLATIAAKSQELISQFEQLTLKSVSQRVGWFLLKLFIENNENTNTIKLPYDKSLIAGYLGMKPETFSRTLQTLRSQGIQAEQNIITLKNALKLCEYCDVDLSARCSRKDSKDCKNADCSFN